jgi:PadR family transcriptional regulator PadR
MEHFERELLRGSLDTMVLSVLADGPKYGYLIQKQLRESSGGQVQAQAGTLYPLLHRLEADKLIKSKWDEPVTNSGGVTSAGGRRRKWYSLTGAGRKRLSAQALAWRRYAECMSRFLEGVEVSGGGKEAAPAPA